jgi:hypothetical protein
VTEEWFRSPDWDAEAREDFERRLGRARAYNRPQYLRLKGLALAEAGEVEAARELWGRVLESTDDIGGLMQAGALEHLADSYADDDPSLAEHYYRRLLADQPSLNGTSATQHVKLAELLLERGSAADLDEAEELLTRWVDEARSPFPQTHFRRQLAAIRLAQARGDRPGAREAARQALDLAGRGPAFSRHPGVGVVRADEATLERLQRLAT